MTAWGAASLVQMVSTIQSSRTAETVVDQKQAVSPSPKKSVSAAQGNCNRCSSAKRVGKDGKARKMPIPSFSQDDVDAEDGVTSDNGNRVQPL